MSKEIKLNINEEFGVKKRLIVYTGMAAVAIAGLAMVSYVDDKTGQFSNYAITDDGNIDFKGNLSYEKLISRKLIKVIGFDNEEQIYIVKKEWFRNRNNGNDEYLYTDILTNKAVINTKTTTLKYEELGNISDYLVSMDMLKDKYNKDDINKLIEYVETCEEKEVEKVKEKTIQ